MFSQGISIAERTYSGRHIYPYLYLASYFYRSANYAKALAQWAAASQVLRYLISSLNLLSFSNTEPNLIVAAIFVSKHVFHFLKRSKIDCLTIIYFWLFNLSYFLNYLFIHLFLRHFNYSKEDDEIYREFYEINTELIPGLLKQDELCAKDPACFASLVRFCDGLCRNGYYIIIAFYRFVEHRQRTIVFYSSLDLALFEASLKAVIYTLCSYYIMRDKYIEIKPVALS